MNSLNGLSTVSRVGPYKRFLRSLWQSILFFLMKGKIFTLSRVSARYKKVVAMRPIFH